jgi:hypothetical protein
MNGRCVKCYKPLLTGDVGGIYLDCRTKGHHELNTIPEYTSHSSSIPNRVSLEVKQVLEAMETYCLWYVCPACNRTNIAQGYSFCPDCGVGLLFNDPDLELENRGYESKHNITGRGLVYVIDTRKTPIEVKIGDTIKFDNTVYTVRGIEKAGLGEWVNPIIGILVRPKEKKE